MITGTVAGSPSPRYSYRRWQQRIGLLFFLPAGLVLGAFYVYPFLRTIFLSMTGGSLLGQQEWIGLENFRRLLTSGEFHHSLFVTVYYVAAVTLTSIPLAFIVALLLERVRLFADFFKAVFFLPVIVSTVIASVVFVGVMHPLGGVLRLLPLPFGLDTVNWYQSQSLVIPGLVVFTIWKQLGVYIVVLLAGLANLPHELREAARVDGANEPQVLRYITIPLLRPVFLFCLVISTVYGFQSFAIIFVSTGGGPANASEVIPLLIYEYGFRFTEMGYASAMALALFLIVGSLTYLQFRLLRSEEGN